MFTSEKRGGNARSSSRMEAFRDCVDRCGLVDLGFVGHDFTWTNKQGGVANIEERLDHGMASVGWMDMFVGARVSHLTRLFSDHCPLLVEFQPHQGGSGRNKRPKLFRFESMWLQNDRCGELVRDCWGKRGCRDPADLKAQLEDCGRVLGEWDKETFGHLKKQLKDCNDELGRL
ncbi:hypothetical protein ACS0TY_002143 [Phlomoides rotata]